MKHVLDTLMERGFVEQATHDHELREYLREPGASCYIGFDPTADSLHVGSLVPIMALAHMQRHGHRPIALVGGGTGLVGDPSGKTESRQLLTTRAVARNARAIGCQLARFIRFEQGQALLVNNAEWLTKLRYIPFLRDIGRHFSVNRMIKVESYRLRLESEEGLSFIEFNYQLLQAYDFMMLCERYGCRLQMGGSDQWGNIVAGIELTRRIRQQSAFGITFPLITTANGAKMGKTAKGAVWLDTQRTSAYDYYQFWVNTDDADVIRFLALFTFLPMNEISSASQGLSGAELNAAKSILAYEATRLAHGQEAATAARQSAQSMFGGRAIAHDLLPSSTIPRGTTAAVDEITPQSSLSEDQLAAGIPAFKLFFSVGLADSGAAARRLIDQGGAYIGGQRVDGDYVVSLKDVDNGAIMLRSGKKKHHKINVVK
jgi:tyrosyl-tRNA synthetase